MGCICSSNQTKSTNAVEDYISKPVVGKRSVENTQPELCIAQSTNMPAESEVLSAIHPSSPTHIASEIPSNSTDPAPLDSEKRINSDLNEEEVDEPVVTGEFADDDAFEEVTPFSPDSLTSPNVINDEDIRVRREVSISKLEAEVDSDDEVGEKELVPRFSFSFAKA